MSLEKATRAELIAALVTDKYSGFRDGDESILEAASDARLEEFRATSEANRTAAGAMVKLETEHRNATARLKIAEERNRASEQALSEEEFLAKAPARFKALIEAAAANEDATKSALIAQLKDCGAIPEDELKKKSLDELKTLASYARVEVPDFSGKGMPAERHASDRKNYAPPRPYTEALKALHEKAH